MIDRNAILIVEDEPFIRHDLIDFFEDGGFRIFEAEDADEAINLMERNPTIWVVLTDVEMPGSIDGLKLARYLRDRYPPTLLLIASGARMLLPADMSIDVQFISKPFNPHAVLRSIRRAH